MFRQGDVLIVPVKKIPKAATTPVPREKGAVVLAHGEATGHMHALPGTKVAMFRDDGSGSGGRRFLKIEGDHSGPLAPATLLADEQGSFLAETPLGTIKFAKSDAHFVTRFGRSAVDIGPFSLLRHDEHDAHAVPSGNHEVIQQREYHPELVRNVFD